MRVAIPTWNGRISPVFDTAGQLLVVDLAEGRTTIRARLPLAESSLPRRARRLAELGVDLLICGAISRQFSDWIKAQGIEVLPQVSGDVEEVLLAHRNGSLDSDPRLAMPGCRRRRHQCRRGHSRKRMLNKPKVDG